MRPPPLRRVLLVGFMGSGKTSVGREMAARLGWRFVDFDDAIETEAGSTIAAIFAGAGEAHFRALEERVARRLLGEQNVVLASGGGWAAAAPGHMHELPPGTATFWLRVSAPEAVRRASRQAGIRPLLERPDAVEEASRLLDQRTPFYREARWTVDTEGSSVDDVSTRLLKILAREYTETHAE